MSSGLTHARGNPARAHALLEKTHYDGFEMLAELVRISGTAKDLDVTRLYTNSGICHIAGGLPVAVCVALAVRTTAVRSTVYYVVRSTDRDTVHSYSAVQL